MRSVFLGLFLISAISISAQTSKPKMPRTPDGHPDLQGTWDFAQLTPFERPGNFAGKSSLSDEEAEEFAQQRIETGNKDKRERRRRRRRRARLQRLLVGFRQAHRQADVAGGGSAGRPRAAAHRGGPETRRRAPRQVRTIPEERPLAERCVLGFNSGPPMVPSAYNNNMQLVQTRDHVLILNEMIHSARIVALSGRPHPPADIRSLTGDSVGRWDGDTLVVDTTNFSHDAGFRGATANMHLVERFTRLDPDTLRYEFTVEDPATWTGKWGASIPMTRSDELIYEYACHESNYGLEGVLKGARYEDQQKLKTQK